MKGKLTIGRTTSVVASRHNKIIVEVRNEELNKVLEIEVDARDFILAVTGMALQECEVKIYSNDNE